MSGAAGPAWDGGRVQDPGRPIRQARRRRRRTRTAPFRTRVDAASRMHYNYGLPHRLEQPGTATPAIAMRNPCKIARSRFGRRGRALHPPIQVAKEVTIPAFGPPRHGDLDGVSSVPTGPSAPGRCRSTRTPRGWRRFARAVHERATDDSYMSSAVGIRRPSGGGPHGTRHRRCRPVGGFRSGASLGGLPGQYRPRAGRARGRAARLRGRPKAWRR